MQHKFQVTQHHVPPKWKGTFGQIEVITGYIRSSAGAASHLSIWTAGRALRGDSDSPACSITPTRTHIQNQKQPSFMKANRCAGFGKPTLLSASAQVAKGAWIRWETAVSACMSRAERLKRGDGTEQAPNPLLTPYPASSREHLHIYYV